MNQPTQEQIEKVAEWWAIRTFDKALNQDNGDKSDTGFNTFMMMNSLAIDARNEAGKDARDKFKAAIVEFLSIPKEFAGSYTLSVDYDPNTNLRNVCDIVGISSRMLPCKTFTLWHDDDGMFRGRHSYGAPWEDVA